MRVNAFAWLSSVTGRETLGWVASLKATLLTNLGPGLPNTVPQTPPSLSLPQELLHCVLGHIPLCLSFSYVKWVVAVHLSEVDLRTK